MLLSIVVPVYNAEKYLISTLESVLSQSFSDWQLILVDDGSTDRGLEICSEFWRSDSRIKIISQENMGVSAARNAGIAAAEGDYLMFLDSDDEYLPGAFSAVAGRIAETGADLIVSSSKVVDLDTGTVIHERDYVLPDTFASLEDFYYQMYRIRIAPGPCRYAIRRQIVQENALLFPVGITIAEDCLWLCNLLGYITSAAYNPHPFYLVNSRFDSVSACISAAKLDDLMHVCDELFRLAEGAQGEYRNLLLTYCNILTISLMHHYGRQNRTQKRIIRTWIRLNRRNFSNSLKVRPSLHFLAIFIGTFKAFSFFSMLVKLKNRMRH